MKHYTRIALASAIAFGLATTAARADVITVQAMTPVLNADSTYSYSYAVTLTDQSQLIGTATSGSDGVSGNPQFGTVYDFGPVVPQGGALFTATGLLSNTFTFSFNNTDTPAPQTSPVDDATRTNIRFSYAPTNTLTYIDSDTPMPPAGSALAQTVASGPGNLGTFTVVSPFAPGATLLQYDGVSFKTTNGTQQQNLGLVQGPGVAPAPVPVPEPASLALLGAGLLGLGMIRRRKSV